MEGKLFQFKYYKVWRLRITSMYSKQFINHTNTDTCCSYVQHDVHDYAWLNQLVYFSPSVQAGLLIVLL